MKSSPPPSNMFTLKMEAQFLQGRIAYFLPWLLLLTAFYVLLTITSSKPFPFGSQDVVLQTPMLSEVIHNVKMMAMSADDVQYKGVTEELQTESPALSSTPNESLNQITSPTQTQSFPMGGSKEQCDLSIGKWVWDTRLPLYTNATCPTLPDSRNCMKYGKNKDHLNWRWKPDGCDITRLEPETFLSFVRHKKMAFVGDSLARNHMESLLCALSQTETPINIYKDSGDKFKTWYFSSHNFTLMVLWTEFLVAQEPHIENGTTIGSNVHLDKINKDWAEKLPELNYLIINNGNWFFKRNQLYKRNSLIGCVSCFGMSNITDLGVVFAVKSVTKTTLQYLKNFPKCKDDLMVVLTTFAPSHFEHSYWFDGGYCNRSLPLDGDRGGIHVELREKQLEEMKIVRGGEGVKFRVMDVSEAMAKRADGHPNSHWTWGMRVSDCLHWCLPGAIDMWNDLLFAIIKGS